MYKSLPYKTKQFLFLLIKLAIIVGAFYFIYNRVVHNEQIAFEAFLKQLETSISTSGKTIFVLLVLSAVNWSLEVLKWQALASAVKKISFIESLQQSLGALTASLFTPNRIGEYGAKVIYYKKGYRRKIILLNLIGNSAQMAVTTLFGIAGLIYFFSHYEVNFEVYRMRKAAYIVAFIVVFILFGSRFGVRKFKGFFIDRIINFFKELPLSLHFKYGLFSIIRYLIFSYQFYFLLTVFNVNIDYQTAMAFITSMYLIASVVPSLSFFDWLIKGSVAVWVFSFYPVNELIIVTISLLMWTLNFALPAIFGGYFILNFSYSSILESKSNAQ